MTANLPSKIKISVLKMWLEGSPRNRIARPLGIGRGSVTAIIQNVRFTMNDIDLLRAVAEDLYKEEVDIYTFASAINLNRKKDESTLSQGLIEKFHEDINMISFKTGIEPKILIEKIVSILVITNNLNLPLDQANNYHEIIDKRLKEFEKSITNKANQLNEIQQSIFTTIEEAAEFNQFKNWKEEKEKLLAQLNELEKSNSLQQLDIIALEDRLEEARFMYSKF